MKCRNKNMQRHLGVGHLFMQNKMFICIYLIEGVLKLCVCIWVYIFESSDI